jgi:peptidylprolyl isomerase
MMPYLISMLMRHPLIVTALLLAALILSAGCTQSVQENTITNPTGIQTMTTSAQTPQKLVRLETNMGNITITLAADMPITAGNFESLIKKGYYDGVIFHRVIDGFMIQGGDPTGTGRGGPGYSIKDEFTSHNRNNRGTISMANAGPNTGGSQFFINLADNNFLDSKHPVFGTVTGGMDVVDAIGKVRTGAGDRPVQNVTIIRAVMV